MGEKSVKTTSRKIEKKISLVTSIMGMVILNIIWVAGIKESEPTFQPSITQKKVKEEIKRVDIPTLPLTVSLQKASLN